MAGSVNRAILIGRVGKDPSTKTFQSGGKIVNFSMATSNTWRDKSTGEKREDVQWHNISVQNTRLADVAERYVRKGLSIYVEGEIRQRSWEQNGEKKYMTEIVIPAFNGQLHILTPQSQENAAPARQPERTDPRGNPQWDAPRGGSTGGDLDDEIPFSPEWR